MAVSIPDVEDYGKLEVIFPRQETMLCSILLPLALASAQGPIPFPTTASWESYTSGVTTGGALSDINGDGHLDFVVANGNDISRQRVEVYYGDGSGDFPSNPQWQSSDIDYHGHLSVGDLDGDGWPDVVVSVFLGAGGFGDFGHVKAYYNQGGQLESTPSWQSADSYYTFSNALGDADGDGDLDLAVAVGEPYFGAPRKNRVYFNQGGTLETTPSWTANLADHSLDAAFADVDGDGDLDLAFCTAGRQNTVYFQVAGVLQTSPGWSSTDNANQNGNSCTFADVDGDGDLDYCVTDNDQLSGGQGVYKIYRNNGSGLATTPFWSDFGGYVSAAAFADLHLDGYPEVIGGTWWGGTEVYRNQNGTPQTSAAWDSSKNSVVEAFALGDLDEKELRVVSGETYPGNGVDQLFYVAHGHLQEISAVRADGVLLSSQDWCADLASGWISLSTPPAATLEVDYVWSESLDLAVTNWDSSIGNLVFLRDPLVKVSITPPAGSLIFQGGDTISFSGEWSSTTNRTESVHVAAAGFPPVGGMRILDFHSENLAPFGSTSHTYNVNLPLNLPGSFLGTSTLVVAVVVNGVAAEQEEFEIQIQ